MERGAEILRSWGLIVEIGAHAFDRWGYYLAGRDQDRLDDLNDALRDPGVRAIFVTCGGKGAYRIADELDFEAAVADPKPVIGCSETTILHLALWLHCGIAGFHGPHVAWVDDYYGDATAESLRVALMESNPVTLSQNPDTLTAGLAVGGKATGVLMGGNLDMLRTSVGWACSMFAGAILLIEAVDMLIGAVDRAFTQLVRPGRLDGIEGVAVG